VAFCRRVLPRQAVPFIRVLRRLKVLLSAHRTAAPSLMEA
jgi:hypothetical protein